MSSCIENSSPHSLQKKNWKRVEEREMFPSKVSAVLNQGSVEDHMSFCAQISPLSHDPSFPQHGIQQTTGGLDMGRGFASYLREGLPSILPGYRAAPSDDDGLGQFGASSEQRSSNSLWSWSEQEGDLGNKKSSSGEDYHNKKNTSSSSNNNIHGLPVGPIRMKKVKTRKNVREPRFCFKTLSEVDVLDDGYKWRKYGQKVVKNTQHPRSYYRCTDNNCRVKKKVERLAEDPRMVITTYEVIYVMELWCGIVEVGEISAEELENLMMVVENPKQFSIPACFLNGKDCQDGRYSQVVSNSLNMKLRDDLERSKMIRESPWVPILLGLRVLGQDNKTTGHRGKTVGV